MITDPQHFLSDTTWKDKYIDGGLFPGKPYVYKQVVLNDTIKNEYLPELAKFAQPKGLKLLATAMTHQEGFNPNTRSYVTHNPGNIGNTDSGANKKLITLYDGVKLQLDKLTDIANGKLSAYPINKQVVIKPYYSEEIARNCVKYQKSPYVPGYRFLYTGELQQFIKIYATGARSGNGYLNTIISYFEQNGYKITGATTLHEIINLM